MLTEAHRPRLCTGLGPGNLAGAPRGSALADGGAGAGAGAPAAGAPHDADHDNDVVCMTLALPSQLSNLRQRLASHWPIVA